jgi:hypothetical protein
MKFGSELTENVKILNLNVLCFGRKMHYPPETTSILLVLRIFAMLKTNPGLLDTFAEFCDDAVNEVIL